MVLLSLSFVCRLPRVFPLFPLLLPPRTHAWDQSLRARQYLSFQRSAIMLQCFLFIVILYHSYTAVQRRYDSATGETNCELSIISCLSGEVP